jgi:hypothetical protein
MAIPYKEPVKFKSMIGDYPHSHSEFATSRLTAQPQNIRGSILEEEEVSERSPGTKKHGQRVKLRKIQEGIVDTGEVSHREILELVREIN